VAESSRGECPPRRPTTGTHLATFEILSWKTIPVVVEARDDAGTVAVQLSDRFQALVDSVATQLGLESSEAYLEAWNRSVASERAGNARDVAETVAAELEARFPEFIVAAFRRP
jgi:cvfA/B/C family virulence factor